MYSQLLLTYAISLTTITHITPTCPAIMSYEAWFTRTSKTRHFSRRILNAFGQSIDVYIAAEGIRTIRGCIAHTAVVSFVFCVFYENVIFISVNGFNIVSFNAT